jgi:preprotein translocase subunit SecG
MIALLIFVVVGLVIALVVVLIQPTDGRPPAA